jgi:hypothetical protein
MSDDFETGLDTNAWSTYGPAGASGGRLVLKPAQSGGSSAGVITQSTFDVASCMVWAELSPFAASVPGDVSLMVSVDNTLDAELWVEQNPTSPSGRDIVFSVEQNSSEDNQKKPYDPVNHRWLRIRFPGQQVVFETSPDGKVWTVQRQAQRPVPLTQAHIELAANVWSWSNTLPSASFDNLNIAPP